MKDTGVHTDISRLLDILKATGKKYDLEKIQSAYDYARDLHEGQFRISGEAYISHPIAVAEIVAGLELDTDSICAALLHDTVEDCSEKTDLKEIEKKFGKSVALLVDGLTKIVVLQVEDKEEAHIENLRKMLLAMSKDVRVIFIKLCDRLHNMRTLSVKPDNKRRITALETMQVYAPLAHRLGMQKIKQELENLGVKYLDPIGYEQVRAEIERKYGQSLNFIEGIRQTVGAKLEENNISYTLEGRIKTVYSIYKKMFTQGKNFDEIYDFYAMRIIVDTELECYTVLGIIHEMFNSMPGRFKDYISTPKPNMYSSLHTTVIGRSGIPFEVQIRTWEMHHIAEYGIAAHWKYKSGATSKEDMDKKLEWIARLIETEDGARDPDEFMHALKTDIFHDEVFVFTPKGDVIALPQGATAIDFAYAIHSAVGNKMIGAKINGSIVPIDRVLENGEIVEVLTSSSGKGPSRDWLNIVKTSEARTKIRQWFKREKRAENIVEGKAQFEAELKKTAPRLAEAVKSEIAETVAYRVGFASADDLYNEIGFGGLAVSKIANKIKEEAAKHVVVEPEAPVEISESEMISAPSKTRHVRSNSGIIVDGESGCQVKFAKCCNPLPGDKIVGFITRGFGVSIHKSDCPNVSSSRKNEENLSR
ncbi:MAG: bifunctional (p)ppGpp synthetase/guanosine-3',5'-bis(diphosphate) 3'-pyrophosphohydrolase, partial [Clostridia bacterium]|nr:bifunctional (p)ppGpp synthetase/guanosine-3',5'-bis(diphosphate) 3'-pyrophosphohydrolase [Clostridia bacterium]